MQDIEATMYAGMNFQLPQTPFMMEDFPQINLCDTKSMKPEMSNECFLYDRYRDCMNGTLEEIISLCSSQNHSMAFPMIE